jgi:hypothetical protein
MLTSLKMLPMQRLLVERPPVLVSAWLIAELLYKWKRFSLETAGFLATWFVLDPAMQALRGLLGARGPRSLADRP